MSGKAARMVACAFLLASAATPSGCGGDDAATDASSDDGALPGDAGEGSDGGGRDAGEEGDGGVGQCGDVPTFADGLEPSAVIHVAEGGTDAPGNGSEASPYATIGYAARQASPGTAVRVHAGDYGSAWIEDLAGTANAPIWIGGAPGEARPVISGGGDGIGMSRVAYLVLHDLEITGCSANGVNASDGGERDNELATHHLLFRNLYIHDIGSGGNEDCLKLSGVNDHVVVDTELARCGGDGASGIDQVGCHRGVIARNQVHDMAASGNCVQAKGGSFDIEFRWNRLESCGAFGVKMGGNTGDDYYRPPLSTTAPNAEAENLRAVANLISGAEAAVSYSSCVDCTAVHNTIVDPDQWIARILQTRASDATYTFEPCSGGRFDNNLVYYDRSLLSEWEDVNVGADTDPDSFVFSHNLWYAHDDPGASQPTLPGTEEGSVVGDPGFTSGYAIDSDSPAFQAGATVSGVPGDLVGHCYRDPPSIGAREAP